MHVCIHEKIIQILPPGTKKNMFVSRFFFVKKVQHGLGLTSFALEAEIIFSVKKATQNSVTRPKVSPIKSDKKR